MKKISLLFILLTNTMLLNAQDYYWGINFEAALYMDRLRIDSVSNPNCIWQIGEPDKTLFTEAYSVPNAIMTDLTNPVPPGNSSSFTLIHPRVRGSFHQFTLYFSYELDGDLTDYGTVEVSPDRGLNWVNILTEDSLYQIYWIDSKPSLKGSTYQQRRFAANMEAWASGYGEFPHPMDQEAFEDTILIRITYHTDSLPNPHDGWIIDDIFVDDYIGGIDEIQVSNLISVYPNPAGNEIQLTSDEPLTGEVKLYTPTGKCVLSKKLPGYKTINLSSLPNGCYVLKYIDGKRVCAKKIVIAR